ncbi:MAG: hypothetical protein WA364_09080 [Candidatus Nitrosopolaris sp.]
MRTTRSHSVQHVNSRSLEQVQTNIIGHRATTAAVSGISSTQQANAAVSGKGGTSVCFAGTLVCHAFGGIGGRGNNMNGANSFNGSGGNGGTIRSSVLVNGGQPLACSRGICTANGGSGGNGNSSQGRCHPVIAKNASRTVLDGQVGTSRGIYHGVPVSLELSQSHAYDSVLQV